MNTAEYINSQKPDDKSMIELEWIRTEFNLPPSLVDKCENYTLRVWDGGWLSRQIFAGNLSHAGDIYITHWQSTPEVVRSADRVACSFREYKGKKYVVIKVWNSQTNQQQDQKVGS